MIDRKHIETIEESDKKIWRKNVCVQMKKIIFDCVDFCRNADSSIELGMTMGDNSKDAIVKKIGTIKIWNEILTKVEFASGAIRCIKTDDEGNLSYATTSDKTKSQFASIKRIKARGRIPGIEIRHISLSDESSWSYATITDDGRIFLLSIENFPKDKITHIKEIKIINGKWIIKVEVNHSSRYFYLRVTDGGVASYLMIWDQRITYIWKDKIQTEDWVMYQATTKRSYAKQVKKVESINDPDKSDKSLLDLFPKISVN